MAGDKAARPNRWAHRRLPGAPRRASRRTRIAALLLGGALLVAAGLWLLRELPGAVDPTWQRILATGELSVCTDPSWPPFEYVEESTGRIVGLDVELAQRLAPRLAPGVQARIVTVGFDGLYDALLAGRCDAVLSALPYEPLRTEDVAYSVAYFNAGLVMVTRRETDDVETVQDLAGRAVGVEWGFVPEGDRRQKSFLQGLGLRRYGTALDVLHALQAGEIDVALVDAIAALGYMRDCDGLRLAGQPLADVNYVVPVRLDSFRLLSEINRVLGEMHQDGTLAELQDRWF